MALGLMSAATGEAMRRQDKLDSVVGSLHEAALGDVPWTVPASTINEVIRTRGNSLAIGRGSSQADAEFFFAQSCFGNERRRDQDQRYFSDFYRHDERVPRALGLPYGQLTPSGDLYTEQEKKTSPAYNRTWWNTKKNGLHVRLDGLGGSHVLWILANSSEPDRGWNSRQVKTIRHLLPHIRQFARVREVLGDASALGNSLEKLLGNDRFGVIQLDRSARIVAANDRARRLLGEGRGFRDRDGLLSTSAGAENAALQRLLARVLPPLGVPPSAGSLTIGRPGSRTRLLVHVTPVARRTCDLRAQRVAALVLISDPARRPRMDAGLVAEALNLTPAESRLAIMVAAGRTVREIAAISGRTEGTVRWHLKQIFRKQGISRQKDLVRRVLSLEGFPGSLRPAPGREQS